MQSRPSNFVFDTTFNFATDSVFYVKAEGMSSFPPAEGNFNLLDNTPMLLLGSGDMLLL